ncbi:MAG: hypothetical protein J5765_05380, partial [Clostridia bacterium]|nr:hypothetical protein [Clostridia bacterium]
MAFHYKEQVKYVTPEIDELNKQRQEIEYKNRIQKFFCSSLSQKTQDHIVLFFLFLHFFFLAIALLCLFFENIGVSKKIILFLVAYLLLFFCIFLARWSDKAKSINKKIEEIDKKLEYEKKSLSEKVKVQYNDGEVHFYDEGQYVSDEESCLLVPDGTIYHYYMGCFIHWKPEQQKTVLEKG